MDVKLPDNVNALIEPLSLATQQTMTPITLQSSDYCELSMDEDGRYFIFQAQGYTACPDHADDIPCRVCGGKKDHWVHTDEKRGHEYEPMDVQTINGMSMIAHRKGASSAAATKFARKIPERAEAGGYGLWKFAATDFTALMFAVNWPDEKIIYKDEEAKLVMEYLLSRLRVQNKRARLVAEFKENKTVPQMPEGYIEHETLPASDYQKVALCASIHQEGYGLFQDAGTGKTIVAVNRVNVESAQKKAGMIPGVNTNIYRCLVLCPRQVCSNWQREFERFSTVAGKVSVLRGRIVSKQRRLIDVIRKEDDCAFGTAIISMDSVQSIFEALKIIPWDLVIIDESHFCKNPSAKRTKWARNLGMQSTVRQKMILTGTPIANSIMDLYSQFEFLGEGLSGFLRLEAYKGFHGQYERISRRSGKKDTSGGKSSVSKLVAIKNTPLLQERIARLAFTITKEEAGLQLPDKVRDIWDVQMTKKQTKVYQSMANDLVLEIEELLETEQNISIDHILTKMLRLAQVTSGHIGYAKETDPDSGEETEARTEQVDTTNPKVDAVIDMVTAGDRDPLGKTIVWCSFIEDMRVLSDALHEAGIEHVGYHKTIHPDHRVGTAEAAEQRFNLNKDCKIAIGNPSSGGVGLNFLGYDRENPEDSDTYCDHVIYFSCNWSATDRSQSEDRAHRRGARMPVRITDLQVSGTIDEEIRLAVQEKRDTAMAVQDVRSILKGLLQYEGDD